MQKNNDPILLPHAPEPGFDKPFIEYPFQLARLKRRGLRVDENIHGGDATNLRQHGYYQLINGYGAEFEARSDATDGEKRYTDASSFGDIYTQYFLDKELGKLLFSRFLDFEEHFKVAIGYSVSLHFGVNNYWRDDELNQFSEVRSYLDISNYPDAKASPINKLHKISLQCRDNPTKWYRENMNHIPPWILLMNTMEWQTNSYYKELPSLLKDEIITEMMPMCLSRNLHRSDQDRDDILRFFYNGLELVRGFRNHIAHNSRMYDFRDSDHSLNKIPATMTGYQELYKSYEYNKGIGRDDLYALLIWLFVCSPDKSYRLGLLMDLETFYATPAMQLNDTAKRVFHHQSRLPLDFLGRLKTLTEEIE